MVQYSRLACLTGAVLALAGCQTNQPQQVSGPWGTGFVSTSGPRYSDPWNNGPLILVEPDQFIDAGGFEPTVRNVTPAAYRANVSLPPDHLPPTQNYGAVPVTTLETAPMPVGQGAGVIVAAPTGAGPSAPAPRTRAPGVTKGGVDPGAPRNAGSFTGSWTAIDATGRQCKIQLSSSSVVDRYRASAGGCAGELKNVNSWGYDGAAVTLFSRDRTVARLSGQPVQLTGAIAGSGTAIDLTR